MWGGAFFLCWCPSRALVVYIQGPPPVWGGAFFLWWCSTADSELSKKGGAGGGGRGGNGPVFIRPRFSRSYLISGETIYIYKDPKKDKTGTRRLASNPGHRIRGPVSYRSSSLLVPVFGGTARETRPNERFPPLEIRIRPVRSFIHSFARPLHPFLKSGPPSN